jgi:hypothetical protein
MKKVAATICHVYNYEISFREFSRQGHMRAPSLRLPLRAVFLSSFLDAILL